MSIGNSYYQDDRAQVIQRGMEMLPKATATVFKRIVPVRIPKIYQRVRQDSEIIFQYQGSDAGLINACGFAIYKELY